MILINVLNKQREKFNSAKSNVDAAIKDLEVLKMMLADNLFTKELVNAAQNNLHKSLLIIDGVFTSKK